MSNSEIQYLYNERLMPEWSAKPRSDNPKEYRCIELYDEQVIKLIDFIKEHSLIHAKDIGGYGHYGSSYPNYYPNRWTFWIKDPQVAMLIKLSC